LPLGAVCRPPACSGGRLLFANGPVTVGPGDTISMLLVADGGAVVDGRVDAVVATRGDVLVRDCAGRMAMSLVGSAFGMVAWLGMSVALVVLGLLALLVAPRGVKAAMWAGVERAGPAVATGAAPLTLATGV
jgi:hypothetical protein